MPRRSKNVRPPEFLSDTEDEAEHRDFRPDAQGPEHSVPLMRAKSPPVPQGSTEIPTLSEWNPDNVEHNVKRCVDRSPPLPKQKEAGDLGQLALLVSVLHQANAGFKGKIDDTGRFELKFQVTPDMYMSGSEADPPSPVSHSPGSDVGTQRSARKKIGWTRPR